MEQITGSRKYQNGIRVSWTEGDTDRGEFFSYDELIDQKVNALDLMNNPRLYLVNAAGHQIEPAAAGCRFATKTCEDEIVITRLLDATREFAWRAWTEPELVRMWWGPRGFTCPSCTIDLRPGGTYLLCMRSPEGRDYWSTGVYREVEAPGKVICTDSFSDEKGNVVPATYYGMSPDLPSEMLLTVTFGVQGGRTELVLRHAGIPAGKEQDLARAGWNESLDKYAAIVARSVFRGKRPVRVTSGSG